MFKRIIVSISLVLVLAIGLTACSGDNAVNTTIENQTDATNSDSHEEELMLSENGLPLVNPLEVNGDIVMAGSSTVFPLAERMLERFGDEGASGVITYDSIGSGAGFERFCGSAETDIAGASRAIKEKEVALCAENGRTPIEFRVGTDALAVVVSATNNFVSELSLEDLAFVFSSAETWAEVNPEWPDEPIQRFIPGTDSGTFDFFVEEIFNKNETSILETNPQMSEDDNVLVQGIEGSPYAIGFFGYAYYIENQDSLNILVIEGIEASAENVDNASYPLARPLFIYSDKNIMADKPQVAEMINFFLTYVNEEIIQAGYFPASDEDLQSAIDSFLIATK